MRLTISTRAPENDRNARLDPPDLLRGDVHVWLLEDGAARETALDASEHDVLSAAELDRARRFRSADQAHQHRLAHWLKRTVLSRYAPWISPRDWRFDTGSHGKPRIVRDQAAAGLAFNLSHATGMIALAVTRSQTLVAPDLLGVDVEVVARRTSLDIARRFFAPDEVRALACLPPSARHARFFMLWTLKESYIKARGLGLAIPLGDFAFSFDVEGAISFRPDPDAGVAPDVWRFAQTGLPSGHALAVGLAAASDPIRLRVFEAAPGIAARARPVVWARRSSGVISGAADA